MSLNTAPTNSAPPNPTRVVVEADGGSRGNPGPAGYGAVVRADDGTVLAERSGFLGVETNNVAEYRGLLAGLEAARDMGARVVAVRMDSNLVVQQMTGAWQIRNAVLRLLADQADDLRSEFDAVDFEWIPRDRNTDADRLANAAMDTGTASAPAPWAPPSGTPTRLWLVRHGSTVHSAERRFSGRNDLPLDPAGSAQAAALAGRAALFAPVASIVSSPLRRARQTADWLGSALSVDVVEDDDLAELDFGDWEGSTAAEVALRDGELLARWMSSSEVPAPGGESIADVEHRVQRARDRIVATFPGHRVLVLAHVTPIKSLVRMALGAPAASVHRMYLDTASVSAVDYAAGGAASLRLFNDTAHLTR